MKNKIFPFILILFSLPISFNLNATNCLNNLPVNGDPIQIIRSKHRLLLYSKNKIVFELSSSKLSQSIIYELSFIAARLIQNPN